MKNIENAVHLIDDDNCPRSGWDYFGFGEGPHKSYETKSGCRLNSDKNRAVFLRRDCSEYDGGVMTYETKIEIFSADGLYFAFGTRDKAFLKLVVREEKLFYNETEIGSLKNGIHYLKIVIDYPKKRFSIADNGKKLGVFSITGELFAFRCLSIGFGEKDRGDCIVFFNKLYVNYLFLDANLCDITETLPDDYHIDASETARVVNGYRTARKKDKVYVFENTAAGKAAVRLPFGQNAGNIAVQIKYLMDKACGRMLFSLGKDGKSAVSLHDDGLALESRDGCVIRAHHKNVWQTLRMVTDVKSGKINVWLNGKLSKTLDFESDECDFDEFSVSFEADKPSEAMFSDLRIWEVPKEPEDYVPEPVIPRKKRPIAVGINVCSLWRNGTHAGWECISPYDDIKPVLGYYDEGIPETADWEIKFMAEHGIDYALYCWYSSESSEPIRATDYAAAWEYGHFYAKYSDKVKIALLWEAANCTHPKSLDDFKNVLVPYWLDYFFSDERYMRIDNKAVMSCFGENVLANDLGGRENVRKALDYLRSEVKKLGYDDLILMGTHPDGKLLAECGFDASHAYHWGENGYRLEENYAGIERAINSKTVSVVPTISVGFNNVGWGGERRPLMKNSDMEKGLVHCIENYLPLYPESSPFLHMLHLSTWNEYGEGTYIMPSGLCGFGYLDAVRSALCEDTPHTDVVPDEAQKARIGYLYPDSRRKLKRQGYDERPLPEKETPVRKLEFKTEEDLDKWEFRGMKNVRIEDGILKGETTEPFAEMELKTVGWDASEISYLRVDCANKLYSNGEPQNIFLIPSNVPDKSNYSRENAAHIWCNSLVPYEYRPLHLDNHAWWSGTIYGFKIIPVEHGTFELRSVTFFAALKHLYIYGSDGRPLFFGDYPAEHGKDVVIPLDPESGLYKTLGIKTYEWFKDSGTLELCTQKSRYTVVCGRAYAQKDEHDVMLSHPVMLKDAVPALYLEDVCQLFGVKYERNTEKNILRLMTE